MLHCNSRKETERRWLTRLIAPNSTQSEEEKGTDFSKRKQEGEWLPGLGTRLDTMCQWAAWVQPPSAPAGQESRTGRTGRAMGTKRLSWKANRQQRSETIQGHSSERLIFWQGAGKEQG